LRQDWAGKTFFYSKIIGIDHHRFLIGLLKTCIVPE